MPTRVKFSETDVETHLEQMKEQMLSDIEIELTIVTSIPVEYVDIAGMLDELRENGSAILTNVRIIKPKRRRVKRATKKAKK